MTVKRVVGKIPGGADYVVNMADGWGGCYGTDYVMKSLLKALKSGMTHHLLKQLNKYGSGKLPKKADLVCVGWDHPRFYVWIDRDPGSTYGWHSKLRYTGGPYDWTKLAKEEEPPKATIKFKRSKELNKILGERVTALKGWCNNLQPKEYKGLWWNGQKQYGNSFSEYLEAADFPWPEEWHRPKDGIYYAGGLCGEKPLKQRLERDHKLKGTLYFAYQSANLTIPTVNDGKPYGQCGFLVVIEADSPEQAAEKAKTLENPDAFKQLNRQILDQILLETRRILKEAHGAGATDEEIQDLWDEVKIQEVMSA